MIVAIRKPVGPTSHDIVDAVRHITGERCVGHAGTLDPLASGVLVIGIGRRATRQLAAIVRKEKEYVTTIRLGATSTTDDAGGTIIVSAVGTPPSRDGIARLLPMFLGHITQIPPAYSAVKVRGQRAYALARRGQRPALSPRTVAIMAIDILAYAWPDLTLRVITGPGAYIRALARDLGAALGTGGYLTSLERTRVGDHTLVNAQTTGEFTQWWTARSSDTPKDGTLRRQGRREISHYKLAMHSKQFLQIGGAVLVLVGILGFIGIIGPTAKDSVFGASWWFDNAENWAHLVLGVVGLLASAALPASAQKPLVMLLGIVGILIGFSSMFTPTFLGANLENPADTILHLAVGAWALWSSKGAEGAMSAAA